MEDGGGRGHPATSQRKRVLHQQFFCRGLPFQLDSFVCGLLFSYGCQLHHLTPNAILHIANYITHCECFLGTNPNFELF